MPIPMCFRVIIASPRRCHRALVYRHGDNVVRKEQVQRASKRSQRGAAAENQPGWSGAFLTGTREEPQSLWDARPGATRLRLQEHEASSHGCGITVNNADIPPLRCSFTWQCKSHVPTASGVMSATAMDMGPRFTTSVRM